MRTIVRSDINLSKSSIKEVLPEHYSTNYPNLIKFLDVYYQFLDGETSQAFSTKIRNMYGNRDVIDNDISTLQQMMYELALNVDLPTKVDDARIKTLRLGNYFRSKGSSYGFKEFFRWMFNEDVVVEYGKNNMFIVGESKIGPDSFKYIKDAELYQTFALLIKTGIPLSQWKDLYTTICHPAGFYFEAEVSLETLVNMSMNPMPLSIPDENASVLTVIDGPAMVIPMISSSTTGIIGSTEIRLDKTVKTYSEIKVSELIQSYDTLSEIIDVNSQTFDADWVSDDHSPTFDNTLETFDENRFEEE